MAAPKFSNLDISKVTPHYTPAGIDGSTGEQLYDLTSWTDANGNPVTVGVDTSNPDNPVMQYEQTLTVDGVPYHISYNPDGTFYAASGTKFNYQGHDYLPVYKSDGTLYYQDADPLPGIGGFLKTLAPMVLSYFVPVLGQAIAAELGVSQAVGTAIAQVGSSVVQGVPVDQAIKNVATNLVSQGILDQSDYGKFVNNLTNDPSTRKIIDNVTSSTLSTALKGGSSQDILTNGLSSVVGTVTGQKLDNQTIGQAVATAIATGGDPLKVANSIFGSLGSQAAATSSTAQKQAAEDKAKEDAVMQQITKAFQDGTAYVPGSGGGVQVAFLPLLLAAGVTPEAIGAVVSVAGHAGVLAYLLSQGQSLVGKTEEQIVNTVKLIANELPSNATADQINKVVIQADPTANPVTDNQIAQATQTINNDVAQLPEMVVTAKKIDQPKTETETKTVETDPTKILVDAIKAQQAKQAGSSGGGGGGATGAAGGGSPTATGGGTTSGGTTGTAGSPSTQDPFVTGGGKTTGGATGTKDIGGGQGITLTGSSTSGSGTGTTGTKDTSSPFVTAGGAGAAAGTGAGAGATAGTGTGDGATSPFVTGGGVGDVQTGTQTGTSGTQAGTGAGGEAGTAAGTGEGTGAGEGTGSGTGAGLGEGTGGGAGEGTGAGTGAGEGTGTGEGAGDGSGTGGTGGTEDSIKISVSNIKTPKKTFLPTITGLYRSPLEQALSAYRPPGEVEGESGIDRQNVWNEASLRLKDALGL